MSSCGEFGKDLLDSNDLDPIYVMLFESNLKGFKLYRWLLAYWCFYDSGTACWIVDSPKYWETMKRAAQTTWVPRGVERRHFRGDLATNSIDYLTSVGLDRLVSPFIENDRLTYQQVMNTVVGWVGFGPWIGFKIADMLECLQIVNIEFSVENVFLFSSPLEGARRLAEELDVPVYNNVELSEWAVETISEELNRYYAPPGYKRMVGVQEVETVLCKWKSHLNERYQIGDDTNKLYKSLKRFKTSKTAQHLLSACRKGKLLDLSQT